MGCGFLDPEHLSLEQLHVQNLISHLDYYFAVTTANVFPSCHPLARIALALVSRALGAGQICLDLNDPPPLVPLEDLGTGIALPPGEEWIAALDGDPMVARAGEGGICPLVLDGQGHLFLRRYYDFQCRLAANLAQRMGKASMAMEPAFISRQLSRHFGAATPETMGQQRAVEKALTHDFVVISGGPGTGKTHITRVIQASLDAWVANSSPLRVLTLAPTGKAAARLKGGRTIHSALVPRMDRPGFRHGRNNPLAADLVIVDEASMIDLALMTRLMEAIPPRAKVILLGDGHQLSPVQAGAVFWEICQIPCLESHRAVLTHNFRSQGKTGIENLGWAVNQGDEGAVSQILSQQNYPDLIFMDPDKTPDIETRLRKIIGDGYHSLVSAKDSGQALERLDEFRVLCAHNNGPSGRLPINHLCEKILRNPLDFAIKERFLEGMIIIQTNDYKRGLFNGDTGIVYTEDGMNRADFPGENGEIRSFRYRDLPAHETAWAMTIHKSQGSEFDRVLILFPDTLSRAVTRELLYTGITRARKQAIIIGKMDVIQRAVTVSMDFTRTLGPALEEEVGCDEKVD